MPHVTAPCPHFLAAAAAAACLLGGIALAQPLVEEPPALIDQASPRDAAIRDALIPPHNAPPLDPFAPAPPPSDQRIGHIAGIALDAARRRLREDMPTGRGIEVGLVEGGTDGYRPNGNEKTLRHLNIVLHGENSKPSGHATGTARIGFGTAGPAPDIDALHAYPVSPWIGDAYLRTAQPLGPIDSSIRVFSHSWIANGGNAQAPILRRVDYVVDHNDVVVVVGVNNGRQKPVPTLLASAYNVISVGVPSGNHSANYTRDEGQGRCKPELLAPAKLTSYSTPVVAGVAAALLEFADRTETTDDNRAETIKSVLLTGAYKPADWKPEQGKPLDRVKGAGIVDIDRSLLMLQGGPHAPGPVAARYGYAFQPLDPSQVHAYDFHAPQNLGPSCLTLTWHRRITGPRLLQPALANLDLLLVRLDEDPQNAESADANPTPYQSVAASISTIDNVEHLYFKSLPAGRYRILVLRGPDNFEDPWDYALSWRFEDAP